MVNFAPEMAACLQRERAYLLIHVHERNPHANAARKRGSVAMPVLRPLAALPPVVALDALGFVPAQGILEGVAEFRVQHEVAADWVVDMALVCIDEVVGIFLRRFDPHDGDFACVYGVHMPDESVALFGREERGQDNPPVAGILLLLLGAEACRRIRGEVVWLRLFGASHYSEYLYLSRGSTG